MTQGLVDALWRIGILSDLPRDKHCAHTIPETEGVLRAGIVPCPECRLVLEVMDALRNERPS